MHLTAREAGGHTRRKTVKTARGPLLMQQAPGSREYNDPIPGSAVSSPPCAPRGSGAPSRGFEESGHHWVPLTPLRITPGPRHAVAAVALKLWCHTLAPHGLGAEPWANSISDHCVSDPEFCAGAAPESLPAGQSRANVLWCADTTWRGHRHPTSPLLLARLHLPRHPGRLFQVRGGDGCPGTMDDEGYLGQARPLSALAGRPLWSGEVPGEAQAAENGVAKAETLRPTSCSVPAKGGLAQTPPRLWSCHPVDSCSIARQRRYNRSNPPPLAPPSHPSLARRPPPPHLFPVHPAPHL